MRFAFVVPVLALALSGCDKGPPSGASSAAKTAPVATTAPAAPATSAAQPTGQKVGAGVSLATTTSIEELLANPSAYNGKTVRVEGMILDVCPKRGCWMDLAAGDSGKKLKFKVTDGEMVFPMEAKGKWAVAEGVVAVKELTLEETKQKAEYEAKEYGKPYDPASITAPTVSVRLDGTGAVITDKKS